MRSEAGRLRRVGGVKFFMDGTVEGGAAWLEHADWAGRTWCCRDLRDAGAPAAGLSSTRPFPAASICGFAPAPGPQTPDGLELRAAVSVAGCCVRIGVPVDRPAGRDLPRGSGTRFGRWCGSEPYQAYEIA